MDVGSDIECEMADITFVFSCLLLLVQASHFEDHLTHETIFYELIIISVRK